MDSSKVHFITVSSADTGQRLDNFLRKCYPALPKSRIYQMLRRGEVRLNKKRVKPEDRINTGDLLRMPPIIDATREDKEVPAFWCERIANAVLYEDDNFLILNKPAGLSVHGGSDQPFGLIDVVRQVWGSGYAELAHRLDRDTSGVLVLGKHRQALSGFQNLMQSGNVEKRYVCLIDGHWRRDINEVRIRIAKGQLQGGERMVVSAGKGQEAVTHFRVLHHFAYSTLLEALLDTGRTHQIRVSVQHRGHAIAGDDKYGKRDFNRKIRQLGFKGMFLHASSITFVYDGHRINVQAPLPYSEEHLLTILQKELI
ncbi:MAG: RluA family pseudouridine synthase [Cardiobacteriaceae bacterium]|nr:RluA family pseudouridine synthase [Cardiobacteriaceae bacterium]